MTPAQKRDYEAQGYLVIENDFDSGKLNELSSALDRLAAADELEDLPNGDDCFIHLTLDPAFFPIVHRIMSDDVQLRTLRGGLCAPGTSELDWHRSVASLLGVAHESSTVCVQVQIHLDETPVNGACTAVVPGSHRFKPELHLPELDSVEAMPHAEFLDVEAGTIVLLHGNLWQAQTGNSSETAQRSIRCGFVHCWMRHDLPDLSPAALEVISESRNLSQLFGLGEHASVAGYWERGIEGYPTSMGLP